MGPRSNQIAGSSPRAQKTVGVLALQGGFTAHLEAIANLNTDISGDSLLKV